MSEKKIYEIVNPSDPYTMVAENEAVAFVACLLLGRGAYGLREGEREACPLFRFGGDPEAWLKEKHGVGIDETIAQNKQELVRVLRSVQIGTRSDRATLDEAIEKCGREWMLRRHDEKRSSLNDIGRRAWLIAERVELSIEAKKDGES